MGLLLYLFANFNMLIACWNRQLIIDEYDIKLVEDENG